MSVINTLEIENESIRYEMLEDVESGVIDPDQISEWIEASPQDISWLPAE